VRWAFFFLLGQGTDKLPTLFLFKMQQMIFCKSHPSISFKENTTMGMVLGNNVDLQNKWPVFKIIFVFAYFLLAHKNTKALSRDAFH